MTGVHRQERMVDQTRLSGKLPVFALLLVLGQAVLAQTEHTLPLVMAASNQVQQGLVRIINHSDQAGTVQIFAIDDSGERFGPVTLSLDALEAVNFDATDLEEGNNTLESLSGGVGDGEGNWHLELNTTLDIEALAYIRSEDGFLANVHDVVADDGSMRYYVPTFNPSYRSLLRLINQADVDTEVKITGRDDEGEPAPEGEVRLTLPPYAACTITALELESGDTSSDCPSAFSGSFGNGTRKWRLLISADRPIQVMSLLRSTSTHLANLSASARDPGFAPADQTAFDARFVGKRVSTDMPSNYTDFVSLGRFKEVEGGATYTGDYTYENTGPNTGTLEFHYDDGDRCTTSIAFESATAGTIDFSCDDGSTGTTNWRAEDTPVADAAGFAPADQTAFDARFVGKRVLTDIASYYVEFVSAGRISEVSSGKTSGGRYTYENTGANAGTLEFYFDDTDRCTLRLTFESATAGTTDFSCDNELMGTTGWRIED